MTTPPPTAQSIAATTEVLELASLLDNRIATPDKARIMAWAKQIDRHQLERDDMLNAVQDFYDRPSPQPINVGDVTAGARRIKRDRLEREEDAQREARQEQLDFKAADETRTLASAITFGPVTNRTPRLESAEQGLHCCTTKADAQAAIREYLAAKDEAKAAS